MLRVLHLITTLDPGGAEHHLLTLCRALREHCELRVAFLQGSGALAGEFAQLGIEVEHLPLRLAVDPWMAGRIRRLVTHWQPQVMHTHLFKADFHGWRAVRGLDQVRLVSSKHNQDPQLRQPLFGYLGRRALQDADAVIAISDAVAGFVERHGRVHPPRLQRIHYGFDLVGFEAHAEDTGVRQELGIDPGAPCALYLGRLVPQKGLETLIEATARLRDRLPGIRLVLAGQGPLEEALRALTAHRALQEHVCFAGFRSDVRALLRSADLLVLPSRWEGFGMVLVEAMAASRPVVATTAGSIPEVVADGVTGLLSDPDDVEGLARNLELLLGDPDRAREMGVAGRRRVEECFSVAAMAGATLELYRRVVERRPAGAGAPTP